MFKKVPGTIYGERAKRARAQVIHRVIKKERINKISYKLIAYEILNFDNKHYIFDEKILPLVGIIPSKNIENSIELTKKILDKKGKGHSAGIYSKSNKNKQC